VVDVTDATFQTEVIDKSHEVPVVVDLWATWCGPCRTLGPIIEQVVAATDGKVVLAKVDTDANPAVANAFQVQSIPAVYALKDGKVVDGFIGAQPEWAVTEFVNRLIPSEEESEIDRLVSAGDETSLRAALELQSDHAGAVVALAELLATSDRGEEALALLERIPPSAETRRVAALARAGADAVDDVDAKLESLLPRVKGDDEARQEYVDLLELLGPDDPPDGLGHLASGSVAGAPYLELGTSAY
jgi:putative thioredoxin